MKELEGGDERCCWSQREREREREKEGVARGRLKLMRVSPGATRF